MQFSCLYFVCGRPPPIRNHMQPLCLEKAGKSLICIVSVKPKKPDRPCQSFPVSNKLSKTIGRQVMTIKLPSPRYGNSTYDTMVIGSVRSCVLFVFE